METKERLQEMYDEAAEEYRAQCLLLRIGDLTSFGKRLARNETKTWETRMKWLDIKLAELLGES